jgi:hypothetical protein
MTFDTYYCIRPTTQLLEKLRAGPSDVETWLGQPELWKNVEYDGAWLPEHHIMQIKLLFLMNFRQTYISHSKDDEIKTFLESLLDPLLVSAEVFDKWWKIERFELDENAPEIENSLETATLDSVTPTGIPLVDAWITYLIEKKGK